MSDDELLAECTVTRTRRSGPGGQHRNKVETAIVLDHRPTGVRVEASERRSQAENRQQAIARLRIELALQVRHPADGSPSALWTSRSRNRKLSVNSNHADFPILLAELLDRLAIADFDMAGASQTLKCSSTQLVRFLNQEPRALAWVNRERHARGLRRLFA